MNGPRHEVIHCTAWLYCVQGIKQGEIARQLKQLRATVVNYLKRARSATMMKVQLTNGPFRQHVLATKLEQKLRAKKQMLC